MTEWEVVIGLEVHVQLATESKIFSSARARIQDGQSVASVEVNRNTDPVSTGHPGTLPVLNKKAVEYAVKAGLATHCKINERNLFARKHYFYPDSPKGYQISQLELPVCEHGFIELDSGKKIGITRIHMEEDAGKSVHHGQYSLVNLNRAGVPLVEVVSEPDLRSAEEAGEYLRKLYAIVTCIGVCDGNLQEGNFRCDANVSIRPRGSEKFGTRTETKNVNSFRFVEKAIEYEVERQKQVLLSGENVIQETRLYDSQKNVTVSMRTKEEAEDYRYFTDPDLPPLVLESAWIESLRKNLPELPDQKRSRFVSAYQLSLYDAGSLTGSAAVSDFFETAVAGKLDLAKQIANLLNSFPAGINEIQNTQLVPNHLFDLAQSVTDSIISVTAAKQLLVLLAAEGGTVAQLIDREGLRQVSDLSALEPVIDQVISANPKQVAEFQAGKEKILGFFVGQVMKATGGKANPALLQDLVIKKLKGQ
jgi:aspartyl-tRNA(Asn)/glutamyl-tRNA(Gln) amidotransferase subunit B